MANTTNTTSYLDPPSLIGRQNNDGTISLTPLELKRLNDFNYAIAKMVQGGLNLANLNADTNQVFTDIEGNVTSVSETAAGLSVSVSNLSGEVSTVSATVNGLDVTTSGGTTYISGDHIKSGTLEGVTLLSINSNNSMVKIYNGGIDLGEAPYYNMGSLYYDMNIGKVYLYSVPGRPIKIESGSNLSIDASDTIYIGASSGCSGNVNIGQPGGTVNINGTLKNNGNAIGAAVFT